METFGSTLHRRVPIHDFVCFVVTAQFVQSKRNYLITRYVFQNYRRFFIRKSLKKRTRRRELSHMDTESKPPKKGGIPTNTVDIDRVELVKNVSEFRSIENFKALPHGAR